MAGSRLAQLEAMIFEGEKQFLDFERRLVKQELDLDDPETGRLLEKMCKDLDQLYTEWRLLTQRMPSQSIH